MQLCPEQILIFLSVSVYCYGPCYTREINQLMINGDTTDPIRANFLDIWSKTRSKIQCGTATNKKIEIRFIYIKANPSNFIVHCVFAPLLNPMMYHCVTNVMTGLRKSYLPSNTFDKYQKY